MAAREAGAIRVEDDDDVVETVARINSHLASVENDSVAVVESLRQLQAVPMTFEALEATKIGLAVNALRKNASSEQARDLAAGLYRRWKALADEHFRSYRKLLPAAAAGALTTLNQVTARPGRDPKVAKSAKCSSPSPVKVVRCPAVAIGASACKQKDEEEETPVSAGKAIAKRSLPEGEKDAVAVKKQRCAELIHGDTPGKAEKRRRLVAPQRAVQHHQHQHTAAATTKPAPASKPTGSKPNKNDRRAPPATAGLQAQKAPMRVSPPCAAASTTTKPKPPQAAPQKLMNGSSALCKRREAPTTSMDEASLATARRRLHERYKEATAIREKRRIQVIDAPVKATQRADVVQRRRVRCVAAYKFTGNSAPVPSVRSFRAS